MSTPRPSASDNVQARPGGEAARPEPTNRMTAHQVFYVFGLNGLGAMALSGGINFAIAYGMLPSDGSSAS